MNKNQRIMVGVGVGILVLLICCVCLLVIVGYTYQEQLLSLLGFGPSQNVARMLPEDTQFYTSINPNLQNVAGYQNLKTLYLDNPDIKALLDEFEAEMAKETDITFEEDIKPWLGAEVVIAMPDLTGAMDNPSDVPPLVIAAQTTDQEASDKFISKAMDEAAKDNSPFTEAVYQDVTLHIQENQFNNNSTVVATFDDFVFVASSEKLIKDMIDKSQGKNDQPSLVDSSRFKKITEALPSNAVATMYLDASSVFGAAIRESAFELPPESTQDLEAFEAMGMAGTLQPDGIQLDFVVTYDVEKMSEQMKASIGQAASPNKILSDVPAEAFFVYNANNLNNIWQQIKKGLESNPDFTEGMQDLEEELDFSIEEDIFSWMTGEYAIVLLEVTPPNEYSPPLGGYALIGTDDVDNARSHIDKVLDAVEAQGELPPFEPENIGGIDMQVFRDFDGQLQAGYGFHNNYFLVGYLEESIKAVASASQNPLTASDNFKAVQNRLPDQNNGYIFADIDRVRQVAEETLSDYEQEDYQENVQPFLTPIHAVGIAADAAGAEQGVSKGVFFILISE